MDEKSIKENIAKIRENLGLTQADVAESIGVSRTAYRNLEKGGTRLLNENIAKLAKLFNMSLEEVLFGHNPVADSRELSDVRENYKEKTARMAAEYEAKIEEHNQTLQYVDALREIIRSKDEIISILRDKQ